MDKRILLLIATGLVSAPAWADWPILGITKTDGGSIEEPVKAVYSVSLSTLGAEVLPQGEGSYEEGSVASVTAALHSQPSPLGVYSDVYPHHSFVGWFEGGSLVSTEASYEFAIFSDRALEARYELASVPVPGIWYKYSGQNVPLAGFAKWDNGVDTYRPPIRLGWIPSAGFEPAAGDVELKGYFKNDYHSTLSGENVFSTRVGIEADHDVDPTWMKLFFIDYQEGSGHRFRAAEFTPSRVELGLTYYADSLNSGTSHILPGRGLHDSQINHAFPTSWPGKVRKIVVEAYPEHQAELHVIFR